MPGGKVVTDPFADEGTGQTGPSREGVGATVGHDISDAAEATSAEQQLVTGSAGGFGGTVAGSSIGGKAGSGIGVPTVGGAAGHTDAIRGTFRFTDPFLKRYVPRYNAVVERHLAAKVKVLAPLREQRKVVQALRDKFAGQTGFWNAVEGFLSDPVALLALAGAAVSGGASTGLAAQRALQGWNKEAGAEDAVKRLDAALSGLDKQLVTRSAHMGNYRPFTVDGLAVDMATLDPSTIPAGAILFTAGAKRGITGTGPLPSDFIDWFKRKHKPLGKLLTPHLGKL